MREITITIEAAENAAKIFKLAREFDSSLELGPSLQRLRSGKSLLTVETDCDDALGLLSGLLQLVDGAEEIGASCTLAVVEGPPKPIDGPPPEWIPAPATRADLVAAIDFEQSIAVRSLPPRVTDLLDRLTESDWFVAIGQPIDDSEVVSGSLADARPRDLFYEDVLIEGQNELSCALCYVFHHHFNRCWNPAMELADQAVQRLVKSKLADAEIEIGQDLAGRLVWLLRNACIESYFSDLVPLSPQSDWVRWIELGHLPYGWYGPFNGGKLVVA